MDVPLPARGCRGHRGVTRGLQQETEGVGEDGGLVGWNEMEKKGVEIAGVE